jgi:hypothetical protein
MQRDHALPVAVAAEARLRRRREEVGVLEDDRDAVAAEDQRLEGGQDPPVPSQPAKPPRRPSRRRRPSAKA